MTGVGPLEKLMGHPWLAPTRLAPLKVFGKSPAQAKVQRRTNNALSGQMLFTVRYLSGHYTKWCSPAG